MWTFIRKYAVEFLVVLICFSAVALLTWGIVWRTYWLAYDVFVPRTANKEPLPALVMLHGRSGDIVTLRQWLGFDEFAQRYGFLVIYPQSHQDGWDFGVGIRERGHVSRRFIDHTHYVMNIIDEVDASHPIDRSRIFIAGVSDGASMAVHMSCVEPTVFRGLISVAATIPFYAVDGCEASAPLSVLLIHGVEDDVMPWQGVMYRQYKVFLSMEESVDWWSARDRCNRESTNAQDYQPWRGQVEILRIDGCRDHTAITIYKVDDGGHTWPGRDHPQRRTRGNVNRDIDATQIVADWMNRFRQTP